MKWLLIAVLVLIAAVLGSVGCLASADAEGRGRKIAMMLWCAAGVVLVLALSLARIFWE